MDIYQNNLTFRSKHNAFNLPSSVTNKKVIKKSNSKNTIKRWDKLYRIDKVQRERLKQRAERQKKDDLKKELKFCTFNPNIKGKPAYLIRKDEGSISSKSNNMSRYDSILNRQRDWMQKRIEDVEILKKNNLEKEKRECSFSPKIRKITNFDKMFSTPLEGCVVDSDAYNDYVTRVRKGREEATKNYFYNGNDVINTRAKYTPTESDIISKKSRYFISDTGMTSNDNIENEIYDMSNFYSEYTKFLSKDMSVNDYKKVQNLLYKELKNIKLINENENKN